MENSRVAIPAGRAETEARLFAARLSFEQSRFARSPLLICYRSGLTSHSSSFTDALTLLPRQRSGLLETACLSAEEGPAQALTAQESLPAFCSSSGFATGERAITAA